MLKYTLERVLHTCPKRLSSNSKRVRYSRFHFTSFASKPRPFIQGRAKLRDQRSGINSVVWRSPLSQQYVKSNRLFVFNFSSNANVDAGKQPKVEDENKKEGKLAQMKRYFKEYKWVFITYWTGTWVAGALACYGVIEILGIDGVALLRSLGSDNIYDISEWDPRILNALIAIEVNELFEIVRFPLIIATTPKVANWWRSS